MNRTDLSCSGAVPEMWHTERHLPQLCSLQGRGLAHSSGVNRSGESARMISCHAGIPFYFQLEACLHDSNSNNNK